MLSNWLNTANKGNLYIRFVMILVQLSHLQRFLEFHHYKMTLVI